MGGYSISVSGTSGDTEGVRDAFAYLVRSLRARADDDGFAVVGQLSDQLGGINANDVGDEPPETAPHDEDAATTDDPNDEDAATTDDPTDDPTDAATTDDPTDDAASVVIPADSDGAPYDYGEVTAPRDPNIVTTESSVYDANDPDNPLNGSNA